MSETEATPEPVEQDVPVGDEADAVTGEGDQAESIDEVVGIVATQAALDEAEQRALRAQAELENYRKRAQRQMEEERKFANLPLMADLLPAIDNLGRAVAAAEQSESAAGLLEGVKMVSDQLLGILKQHHCEEIAANGEQFDPNLHEAVAQEPSDLPAGTITRVISDGYQLNGRVVRSPQVMVSVGPPANDNDSTSGESQE